MLIRFILISVLFSIGSLSVKAASDLDDGIGIDTPINDSIGLGKNVLFIKQKALAKAKSKSKGGKDGDQTSSCGSGNIVIGAGSKIKEVYNISTNKGTTAVCGR